MTDLGSVLIELERFDEAEPLLLEGLEVRRNIFGAVHPATASSLNMLGRLQGEQERWSEALAYHNQALPILETVYGGSHPETLLTQFDLGYIALQQGRLEDAHQQIAAVESELSAIDPADKLLLAEVRFQLAKTIVEVDGDLDLALELAEAASVQFQAHPDTIVDELEELNELIAKLR